MHEKAHFKNYFDEGPTFTVRLTVEVNFFMIAYRRFIRIEIFETKMAKSLLSKNSP